MKTLFEPFQLGDVSLSNRIVMAPMTRCRADAESLAPTPIVATYYAQRASAGLIISEGTVVSPMATGYVKVPGIYTAQQVSAWSRVTDAVHRAGGKIFAQLWHVGRISHPDLLGGRLPLAPSAINPEFEAYTPTGPKATVTPKAMSVEEIEQTVADFKSAGENAIAAGFDGVELHAANAYLFHQFMATSANERVDAYGGNTENRARFLFEVLNAVGNGIGVGRTGIRLNPGMDQFAGIVLDEETTRTFDHVVSRLDTYGLAYLHLTGITAGEIPDPAARIVRTAMKYRKMFKGTLIINHGMGEETAHHALKEDAADLVAFGEPFIANPDLVRRFQNGLSLNQPDRSTFYQGEEQGYIDYALAD
jgi:N-ethylmaleimide reductase